MQSSIPTFTAGVVSLCMFCTVSLTTIERHPQMDYTRITDSRISMTSTYMGYTEMSENLGERVAKTETEIVQIMKDIEAIPSILERVHEDVNTKLVNIKESIEKLSKLPERTASLEGKMQVLLWGGGIAATIIVTLLGFILAK